MQGIVLLLLTAVIAFVGLFWRWRLRGILAWFIAAIVAFFIAMTGLVFAYYDPELAAQSFLKTDTWLGIGLAILLVMLSAFSFVLLVAEIERYPWGKTFSEAVGRLWVSNSRRGAEYTLVDGEWRETRAAEPGATEPSSFVITKNHAVVFEDKAGKFTHAEFGPTVVTARHEDVYKCIIVTRPRFKRLILQRLVTGEGIVIETVDFTIQYRLETDPHLSRTANIQQPISQETLLKAVYGIALCENANHIQSENWEHMVQEMAAICLRREFAGISLTCLFNSTIDARVQPNVVLQSLTSVVAPAPYVALHALSDRVRAELNKEVKAWGVQIDSLQITRLELSTPLRQKLEERWMAECAKEIQKAEGIAEANRISEVEKANISKRKSQIDEWRTIFQDDPAPNMQVARMMQMLRYLEALARIAESPNVKSILPTPEDVGAIWQMFGGSNPVGDTRPPSGPIENVNGVNVVGRDFSEPLANATESETDPSTKSKEQ